MRRRTRAEEFKLYSTRYKITYDLTLASEVAGELDGGTVPECQSGPRLAAVCTIYFTERPRIIFSSPDSSTATVLLYAAVTCAA